MTKSAQNRFGENGPLGVKVPLRDSWKFGQVSMMSGAGMY
jgi:hypothetical protein